MSLQILVVAPLVSLFFFPVLVTALGVSVTATCTQPSFSWTFNSFGQSPCIVAGYMIATCYGGTYGIDPLSPGTGYVGGINPSECDCSTIGYSLLNACAACQNGLTSVLPWSQSVANCTPTLPPSQFPNPVPAGIYVPHWAILDVTIKDLWSANESYAAGDNPEYGPGAVFGPSGVYTTIMTSASASASSTPSHSGGQAGAIAGGVIGGIAIISISIAVVTIFYLRQRRSQAASAGVGTSRPMLNDRAVAQSLSGSPLTMKFYDPNDPTTFPEYQGGPRSLDNVVDISPTSQVPLSSHVGSGSTLADAQTSVLNARGYHGLPMPSV